MRPNPRMVTVIAPWDPDAAVWVATSDDVPGLVTEAEDFGELEKKLQAMIPELLEANNVPIDPDVRDVPLNLIAHREGIVSLRP